MNITVLTIQPSSTSNSWDVVLEIAHQQSKFTFRREPVMIGDRQGWALTADPIFYETFKFNQHITHRVQQLLRQVMEQQAIELPVDVGIFFTPEEAQSEMARRREKNLSRT